jgi:hypothetical protein
MLRLRKTLLGDKWVGAPDAASDDGETEPASINFNSAAFTPG